MGLFDSVLDVLSGVPSQKSIDRDQKKLDDWGRDTHRTLGDFSSVDYELDQLDRTEDEIKKYRKELQDEMRQFDD